MPEYLCARILDVKYSTDVAPGFLKAIMFPLVTSFHVQKKVSRFQPLQSRKKWESEKCIRRQRSAYSLAKARSNRGGKNRGLFWDDEPRLLISNPTLTISSSDIQRRHYGRLPCSVPQAKTPRRCIGVNPHVASGKLSPFHYL